MHGRTGDDGTRETREGHVSKEHADEEHEDAGQDATEDADEEGDEVMPVSKHSVGGGKVRVSTPGGVKAKATTPAKAAAQERLLNAVEHSDWRPTGTKAKR